MRHLSVNGMTFKGEATMERLEGGQVKIIGRACFERTSTSSVRSRRSNDREVLQARVAEEGSVHGFFKNVSYSPIYEYVNGTGEVSLYGREQLGEGNAPESVPFEPRTIYHGWNDRLINAPRMRNKQVLNVSVQGSMNRPRDRYLVRNFPTFWSRRAGETVYVIKFDGQPYHRGYFYTESQTLVLGDLVSNYLGPEYLEAILTSLRESGLLTPYVGDGSEEVWVPVEPVATSKKIIEFHPGGRIIVHVPVEQKEVTLGCDPEYEYIYPRDGNFRPDRAPSHIRGTGINDEIGLDGAGNQVEIRPKAFADPADVVSYMIGILSNMASDHLSTKGDRYPLGGHIHVGVGDRYTPPEDLLWLLDYFLGHPTADLNGTARGSYTRMSGYETKRWGFEYRTAPAAIFNEPEFARLAMKAVKKTVEAYINGRTIVVNRVPEFSDYWNYCSFTPREYERWIGYIADYKQFMIRPNAYEENVVANWVNDDALAQFPSQVDAISIEERQANIAAGLEERNRQDAEMRALEVETARHEISIREAATYEQVQRNQIVIGQSLHCNDQWFLPALRAFRSQLKASLAAGGMQRFSIMCFGLRANRRNVTYGYNVEGFNRMGNDWFNQGSLGVPASVRLSVDVLAAQRHAIQIANSYLLLHEEDIVEPIPALGAIPAQSLRSLSTRAFVENVSAEPNVREAQIERMAQGVPAPTFRRPSAIAERLTAEAMAQTNPSYVGECEDTLIDEME